MLTAALMALALPAWATEPLDGWFVASENCAAYQSKSKRSNPGEITLTAQERYALRGTNAPARDWVQVVVPGAPVTTARWVPRACGDRQAPEETGTADRGGQAEATDLVLALSWLPAFCETRPEVRECRALNAGGLAGSGSRLSLHGLWPQPRDAVYCGVSEQVIALDLQGRWAELPAPRLDAETRARLNDAMPGTASHLDRHEWIKHGSCFFGGGGADAYFDASLALLDAVNASGVADLLAARTGKVLQVTELRATFDMAFGKGAGQRVEMQCLDDDGRHLLRELRIHLNGKIEPGTSIGDLMRAAPPQPSGCRAGIVDRAGLQ